ncbi:MAG TPA: hypothetical protein VGD81_05620 [Opitutaceae bacterium]
MFESPFTLSFRRFTTPLAASSLIAALACTAAPAMGATPTPPANAAAIFGQDGRHVIALNQVGYETLAPKRFTAPLSPDGTAFEIVRTDGRTPLFSGTVRGHIGDFSAFQPEDTPAEYRVVLTGGGRERAESDPFAIRRVLWQEQFWPAAVDFMIDCRSVIGTHPSAYGGSPWRDGTYYDFAVPSLVALWLVDRPFLERLPRQIDWNAEKARALAPDFPFDAKNPHSEGVMDAVHRYFNEIEPPPADAPDIVKLMHWGLGYYLIKPVSRDPSKDPLPAQIHGQTVEMFAYVLYAWPELKTWLPQSFYDRCRDFAFAHWRTSGLLEVSKWWDASTYTPVADIKDDTDMGGYLLPYKGRHPTGHSIQPNLLMYEVAKREGRSDADDYLHAAQTQARWIIEHVDWNDPRTTKGHRMSEFKTVPGLVWFLQHFPQQAPDGLREKVAEWARVMVSRSDNMWDFRRFDLEKHWTIPRLNEPGNLAAFTASAIAASWVIDDAALRDRLRVLAAAHMDNLFGRNPQLATATTYPQQGFPLVERGWPLEYHRNVCARIELTRGAIVASPGSEKYPFNPEGKFRHPEGWVNFNAAWNVALATWETDRRQQAAGTSGTADSQSSPHAARTVQ